MKSNRILFAILWVFLYSNLLLNNNLRDYLIELALINPRLLPMIVIVGQIFFSLLILPGSIFTLLSGVIWGFELGMVYSTFSTIVSSCVTFIAGKYIHNNLVHKDNLIKIDKIIALINKHHWKAAFFAYINPLIPSSSLGFIFGASTVKFRFFILGATLGTLPLQLFLVFLGSAENNFSL